MGEPIAVAALAAELDCTRSEHIALVGGGGKTTSLFALARSLPGNVIATTTTRMASDRTHGLPVCLDPDDETIARSLRGHNEVLVWRDRGPAKARGVDPDDCDRWFTLPYVDHVVVEADGARRHPFTAPHVFEPVIPASATLVIACIGADAIGRVIADQCHRPLRVAAAAECSPYERLTPARAATALLSDRGSRKQVPDHARFAVVIHAVRADNRALVDALADHLIESDAGTRVVAVSPVDETRLVGEMAPARP